MNRFCITDYDENTVMHCPTRESAKIFLKFLSSLGKTWMAGDTYEDDDRWEDYSEDTCYRFEAGTYSELDYYLDESYRVLEFDDFDWEEQYEDKSAELAPPMSFEEMFYGNTVGNQTTL